MTFAPPWQALAAVVLAGQVLPDCFVRLEPAPVIGEVVAGIFLGPRYYWDPASRPLAR